MVIISSTSTTSMPIHRVIVVIAIIIVSFAADAVAARHEEDNNAGGGSTRNIVKRESLLSSSSLRSLIESNTMMCQKEPDGSVVCELRMTPDPSQQQQYENCVPISTTETEQQQLCIAAQIFTLQNPTEAPVVPVPITAAPVPITAAPVPVTAAPVEPVPVTAAPTTAPPTNTPTAPPTNTLTAPPTDPMIVVTDPPVTPQTPPPQGSCGEMRCPRIKPTSGTHCNGWLNQPDVGCCDYDGVTCKCDRNLAYNNPSGLFNSRLVLWNCGDVPKIDEGIDLTPIKLTTFPTNPPVGSPPTDPPYNSRPVVLSKPRNRGDCPETLEIARVTNCGRRDKLPTSCLYLDDETNPPTKYVRCRCNWDDTFLCQAAPIEIYGSSF